MSGNRRLRDRRRARPQQAVETPPPPLAPASLSYREVAVTERPSNKTCDASRSIYSPSSESHVWENLLDILLHQIIALISSFHDLLAFSDTCDVQRLELLHIACTIWAAHMVFLSSPIGDTTILWMCTLVLRLGCRNYKLTATL